jgi:hypothetical protein
VALPVITAVPLVAANVCEPENVEPLMLVVCALAGAATPDTISMTAAATAVPTALFAKDVATVGRTHLLRRRDPLVISKRIIEFILCTLEERRPALPRRLPVDDHSEHKHHSQEPGGQEPRV